MDSKNQVSVDIQAALSAGHLTPISSQTILANLNATTIPATIGDQISRLESTLPVVLNLVLDTTGSLDGYEQIMVDAINDTKTDFIKMRTKTGQEVYMRITEFSERGGPNIRILRDFIHVQEMDDLTLQDYQANGMTPLYEAVYDGVTATTIFGASAFAYGATGVQEVTVILSDGIDNPLNRSSRTRSEKDVRGLLKELNTKPHFVCAFVGVGNEDDFRAVALGMGILDGNILTVDKTKGGITKALKLVSSSIGSRSQTIQAGAVVSSNNLFTTN